MNKKALKKNLLLLFVLLVAVFASMFAFGIGFSNSGIDKNNISTETVDVLTTGYTFVDDSANAKTGTDWRLTENGTLYTTQGTIDSTYISSLSSIYSSVKNIIFTADSVSISATMNSFTALEGIYIESGYTSLETSSKGGCFGNCSSLKVIYIKHLDTLQDATQKVYGIFYSCTSLENVEILGLADTFKFGHYSFYGAGSSTNCFGLEITGNNVTFGVQSFCGANVKTLKIDAKSVTIDEGGFYKSKLETVSINSDYTSLETSSNGGCFGYCSSLKTLYIKHLDILQDATQSVYGAFSNCTSLESVVIDFVGTGGGNVNCLVKSGNTFKFGHYSFYGAGSSTNCFDLKITGNDVTFGIQSFCNANVKSLEINADKVTISDGGFYKSKLETVSINSDYTSLETSSKNGSFGSCSSLKTVYIKHLDNLQDADLRDYGIFYNCTSLESIEIVGLADTFKFGHYSFYGAGSSTNCFDLKITGNNVTFGVQSFYGANVKSLEVNADSVTIYDGGFYKSKLETACIYSNYTSLLSSSKGGSFGSCSSLKAIYIKHLDNLAGDGQKADGIFYNCTSLESVEIVESAESFAFGPYAFNGAGKSKSCFDLTIKGKTISFSASALSGAYLKDLKVEADSISFARSSLVIANYNSANLILNADSVSFTSDSYDTYGSYKGTTVYLKTSLSNYDTLKTTLENKKFTVSSYDDYVETSLIKYIRNGANRYYALAEIKDKTITSFSINENCKEILAGVFADLALTYNEYENGQYIGTSTNPYYALIKAKGDITLHKDLVVIANDAFNGLGSIIVTIPEDISQLDATKFSGASSVELVIPNTWTALTKNSSGVEVLKNIFSAVNITFNLQNANNISSLTVEEFNLLKNIGVSGRSRNANSIVKIISCAEQDTAKNQKLYVGEMLAGEIESYTGNLFYVWKIGDNLDYRIFTSTDTISEFAGTSFIEDQKYYKTKYIATMAEDVLNADTAIILEIYDLQSDGLKLVGTADSTLNTQVLGDFIPSETKLTLAVGNTKDVSTVLEEFVVLHANVCVKVTDLVILEGKGVVSVSGSKIKSLAAGDAKVQYTIKVENCYCHGIDTTTKTLSITVEETNSFNPTNACIEASLTPNSYVYDGTDKTPTLTVFDSPNNKTLVLGTDYEIDSTSVTTAKNVATYSIIVKGIGNYTGQRTLTWEITKIPNPAVVTIDDWTYGDTAKSPVTSGNLTSNTPTYTYKLKGAGDSTFSSTVPTNAGTYILKTVIAGDNNYEEFTSEVEFNIFPKAITVSLENKSSVYGNAIVELTATCDGLVAGDSLADAYKLSTTATSKSDVGEYTITGTQNATCTNYTITFVDGTYTITIREIVIDWCEDNFTYNGTVQEVTATYKDINNNDIALAVTIDKEFKNATTGYIATASFTSATTNYKLPDNVNENYTIKPKPLTDPSITAILGIKSRVFDNTEVTNTIEVKDGTITLLEDTDYTIKSGTKGTNIGTYTLVIEGKGNYCETLSLPWRITKKLNTAQVTIDNWTYGDTAKSPVTTNNSTTNEPTYTYKLKDALDSTYTSTVPTNAGTYILKTVIAGDDNYEEFTSEVEFNIFPKAIMVAIENKSSVYGDAIAELTATCDGIVLGDSADDIYTLSTTATSKSNVGDYAITGTQKPTCTNYTVTFENGKYTITAKAITVTIGNKSSVYGDTIVELTATCNGIVSGDNVADICTLSTTATSKSNVGEYAITGTQKSTCTNYTVTFENGKYTITAKSIIVKIDNKSSVYGEPIVELTATCNGIISGDNIADIYTLSTDVTSTSKVGKYVITGTQVSTCTNYVVTFINGTYEISNEDADADTVATINIIIKDGDTPVDNARVELIYLERIIQAGETDENGAIAFTNVLYGNYSIAVIYNSTKLTDAIDVFESSVDKTVVLPKSGFNTILKGDAATSSDNLSNAISPGDKNSASGTVTITMTANYTADQDIIDLITNFAKNEDSGITMVDFIDVGVDNNGSAIKTTYGYQNIVFEISNAIADAVKSYGTEKYDHLIVYREHEGVVSRLNKVTYANGMNAEYECFFIKCVNDHYYITIHVKNFSTYAFSVTTSTVPYYVDVNPIPDPAPANDGGLVNPLKCFIHWITLIVTILFVIFELFVLLYTARTSYDEEETKVLTGDDAKKALKDKDSDTKVILKEENKKEKNSQEVLDKVESKEVTTKIKRHKPLWWFNLAIVVVFAILSVVLFMLGFCVICLILMIIDIILAILALILLFRNFIINHLKDTKNVTLSKFVKYLQKIDESVSLKDAINLVPVLPVALFAEINKKTIADYVDTLENTTTNRKEDFVKGTKLYLADTHYITYKLDNGKSKKKCFIYVYQDLDNKKVFLLLKLTMNDLEKFVEDHPLCTTSRFPIGFEWTFVGIDETFKFSDVEDLIKLTIEVVSKDDSQKNKKVDKTSSEQNAYMSSVKDTEGNLLDQDDKKDNK